MPRALLLLLLSACATATAPQPTEIERRACSIVCGKLGGHTNAPTAVIPGRPEMVRCGCALYGPRASDVLKPLPKPEPKTHSH